MSTDCLDCALDDCFDCAQTNDEWYRGACCCGAIRPRPDDDEDDDEWDDQ